MRLLFQGGRSAWIIFKRKQGRTFWSSAIDEFNKELEDIFGQPPAALDGALPRTAEVVERKPTSNFIKLEMPTSSFAKSEIPISKSGTPTSTFAKSQIPCSASDQISSIAGTVIGGEQCPFLSHVDVSGTARMVDVSEKPSSKRVAVASCKVKLGDIAFRLVAANQISKGDVLSVAKLAGICGAKQTSNLIPLCHNIALGNVDVITTLNEEEKAVDVIGEVTCVGQTGVEMEAMTAVSVAGLTVYDMCKAVSKDIQITNIQLEMKSGGKSGNWMRDQPLQEDVET